MKKIEICMLGRRKDTHEAIIWKVNGERVFKEKYPDEKTSLGIGFFGKCIGCTQKWSIVNLYTGLFVISGKTKTECLEEFEKKENGYKEALKKVNMEELRKRFVDLLKA